MTDTDKAPVPQAPPPRRAPTFLGRLSQAMQRQDWFAVVLEVLIVVGGVLIALAANDWASSRQDRQVEVNSLRALSAGLSNDLVDIRVNLENHRNAYEGASLLREHMRAGLPYSDTLDTYFAYLYTPSWSIRDLAAYETLKQRGMETITNDTLRAEVGRLYGYTYEAVLGPQEMTKDFVNGKIVPYMSEHFRDLRLFDNWTPIVYEEVESSSLFRSLLDQSVINHGFLLGVLTSLEEGAVALIADLNAEVARLE